MKKSEILNKLKNECQNCHKCELGNTRTNIVFSDGNPDSAKYILVGEAPGANEDLTGTPLREFLYVDDMADACVFLLENYSGEQHVNIGTGKEVTIKELAETVKEVVGYQGEIIWNKDMPDGTPRKLTNVDKLHGLGWTHKVELREGVQLAYDWFRENVQNARM